MRVPTVIGLGNTLLGDEGLGVRAAQMLRRRAPAGVRVLEAGAPGLDLLPDIEGASHLLILDCIDAGLRGGEVLRMTELPRPSSTYLSPHQIGLADLIAVAALHGTEPGEVVVMGIQPARIAPGIRLSPEVSASLHRLVGRALVVLDAWVAHPASRAAPGRSAPVA